MTTAPGARRRVLVVLAAAWLVASVGLAAAGGGRWWRFVAPETSPMTWVQSVALVLAAAGAAQLAVAAAARGEQARARTFIVLMGGFAGLALDERFALHERLRDRVLAPRGVGPGLLPWVAPGDVVLLVVAAAGLVALRWVVRALREDRGAHRALWTGVALSVLAVAADSVDPARWGLAGERLEQTLEEVVELAAGLSFVAAVTLPLITLLVPAGALPAGGHVVPDQVAVEHPDGGNAPTALGGTRRSV